MIEGPLPTLLLTAFRPFGGDTYNPTEHAVKPVAEAAAAHAHVLTEVLPVEYGAACARVRELVRTRRPDVVVSLGLAAGRSAITPERVAINLAEARIPDEAGAQPAGIPLVEDAAAAHFSTLPVAAMVAAAAEAGAPAAVSYSAGTFVCNAVMFAALDEARALRREHPTTPEVVAGFIHVPQAAEASVGEDSVRDESVRDGSAASAPMLPQAEIDRGLAAAVCAAIVHRGALPVPPAGAVDQSAPLRGGASAAAETDVERGPGEPDTPGRPDSRMPGIGATH